MTTQSSYLNHYVRIGFSLTFILWFLSCNSLEEDESPLLEYIGCDERFSILQEALKRIDLNDELTKENVTFFAPTDEAFANSDIDIEDLSDAQLELILGYAISPDYTSRIQSAGLSLYVSSLAYSGDIQAFYSIYISRTAGEKGIRVNDLPVLEEVDVLNGKVIITETLLKPMSIHTMIEINNELTVFDSLLKENPIAEKSYFEGRNQYDFTFFTPNDNAYEQFGDLERQKLLDVQFILYSMTIKPYIINQLDSGSIETMHNDICLFAIVDFRACPEPSIMTYKMGEEVFFDEQGNSSGVLTENIIGTNGVIHIMDNVLLPPF